MAETEFNLEEITKSANNLIKIIDSLLRHYTSINIVPLTKTDTEDTQQIGHFKESYSSYVQGVIRNLLAMRQIQTNEILPRCEALTKEDLEPSERQKLEKEINMWANENYRLFETLSQGQSRTTDTKKLLKSQVTAKTEIHQIFSKKVLAINDFDIMLKKQKFVIPKEDIIVGKIISFEYSPLKLDFKIQKIDNKNMLLDLVHITDKEKIDEQTVAHYKNIPIAILETELKRRIILLRKQIQRWAYQNRAEINKIGEQGLRIRLKSFDVFTDKEIDNIIKGTMEKIPEELVGVINEYQSIVSRMVEQSRPPGDYKKELDKNLQNLIDTINKAKISLEQKRHSLKIVYGLIIKPIINGLANLGFPRESWLDNLEKAIKDNINNYNNIEKMQASAYGQQHRIAT